MLRAVVLVFALLPFLGFAGADFVAHFKTRKPGWMENVLHVFLGAAQGALVLAAFRGAHVALAFAVLMVAAIGALDEYVFHRDLPLLEADLHAKGHFALFVFVAVAFAWDTLAPVVVAGLARHA